MQVARCRVLGARFRVQGVEGLDQLLHDRLADLGHGCLGDHRIVRLLSC